MPKPIDMEELLELISSGAKISTEKEPVKSVNMGNYTVCLL